MAPTVELTSVAASRLEDLHALEHRPREVLVEDALGAVHRTYVGEADEPVGSPFRKRYSDRDADVVLRQSDPTEFELEEPFRYVRDDGTAITVPRGDVSDLASVPGLLTWLVPRYGRHTLPALLHDHLVVPGMDPDEREAADTTFRDAMAQTGVPFVRRWVMWAGVSVATLFKRPLPWRIWAGLWVAVHALAGFDLFFTVVRWYRVPLVSAVPGWVWVAGPLVWSVLWLRRYRFGLISAWVLLVLPVPLVAVFVAGGLFSLAEGLAQVVLVVRRRLGADDVVVNPVRVAKMRR